MTNGMETNMPLEALGKAPGRGRLTNRRILVVGGGQNSRGHDEIYGNGRAMSILFAREGASVAVADIDGESAIETVSLAEQEGTQAFALTGDASNESDMKRMIQEACEKLGGLDGLVLNVGIGMGRFFEHTSVEEWDKAFAVNVRSHFMGVKYGLPVMDSGGSIILISSVAAFGSSVEIPSYSSTKAALTGICLHAATAGAPKNIRCNIIAPGLIDTPLGRNASERRPSRGKTPIPLGRQGTAWEVAYAANFLLSNEASYITGHTLIIDGGKMIR